MVLRTSRPSPPGEDLSWFTTILFDLLWEGQTTKTQRSVVWVNFYQCYRFWKCVLVTSLMIGFWWDYKDFNQNKNIYTIPYIYNPIYYIYACRYRYWWMYKVCYFSSKGIAQVLWSAIPTSEAYSWFPCNIRRATV